MNGWRQRSSRRRRPTRPWLASWRAMEDAAQSAIEETLAIDLSEPLVARHVYAHAAGSGATVVVSASMPIRDLEWYAAPQPSPPACWPTVGPTASTALSRRPSVSPQSRPPRAPPSHSWVTWPSSTTSRVWSTSTTRLVVRSSSSTTVGEGSSRSCLRRGRSNRRSSSVSLERRLAAISTPWLAASGCRCTKSRRQTN